MKDFGPGFPEWTELGQDGGLDPLGMQRPIEAIYQSLLPGISTITLRFRYYSFFVWMLEVYASDDRLRSTDPAKFRLFHRRCEILFALIAARVSSEPENERRAPELGVAGIEWAQKQLAVASNDPTALKDFSLGADPETDPAQRYLRNKGGAFGGIYATQMFEMGLITLGDERNPISVCTNRALPLAEAFAEAIGELGSVFIRCVTSGNGSAPVIMRPNRFLRPRTFAACGRFIRHVTSRASPMRTSSILPWTFYKKRNCGGCLSVRWSRNWSALSPCPEA